MEQYFLTGHEIHYFIFTDKEDEIQDRNRFIHIIFQKNLGWPYNTLYRFKMFRRIDEELKDFDYIFFLNANMVCVADIPDTILPNAKEKLLAVLHPGFYNKDRSLFTYETNPSSLAYIPDAEGKHYFMGGFNGGIGIHFRKLINDLYLNIEKDMSTDKIIALWHDESHLNKYLSGKNPKILSPSYGYPEDDELPFEKKIIILHKKKLGGADFLRGIKKPGLFAKIKNKVWHK